MHVDCLKLVDSHPSSVLYTHHATMMEQPIPPTGGSDASKDSYFLLLWVISVGRMRERTPMITSTLKKILMVWMTTTTSMRILQEHRYLPTVCTPPERKIRMTSSLTAMDD